MRFNFYQFNLSHSSEEVFVIEGLKRELTADIQVVKGQNYPLTWKRSEGPPTRFSDVIQRITRGVDVTAFSTDYLHLLIAVSSNRSFCNQ